MSPKPHRWFTIALTIFVVLGIGSPASAHTRDELNTWLLEWDAAYEQAVLSQGKRMNVSQGETEALLFEYDDMRERHPHWDGTFIPEPVARPSSTSGSGSTGGGSSGVSRDMGSNVEQWRGLVAAHFPADQVDMALRVMACESGGNPNAANPSSYARGLMQVMWSTWGSEFGVSEQDLYDPEINMASARKVYDQQGWNAWTCWKR